MMAVGVSHLAQQVGIAVAAVGDVSDSHSSRARLAQMRYKFGGLADHDDLLGLRVKLGEKQG